MSRNSAIKVVIMLGVLIAISCSLFSPKVSTPSKSENQAVSVTIIASQGGQLSLPDKTVLKIPADSLQTDTQISLSKISVQSAPVTPKELSIVGGAYEINLGNSSLQKPATLEIPFDLTLLPAGTESGQVFLSYYDEIKKEWIYAGGVVDKNRNVVVLEITHASFWMPTTWNWAAWIAVLDKLLSGSIVDWIEAAQLLTDDCPQTGNYVQVDSSQALNLVQGCVEVDDSQQPVLRIINPKSFFYEIKPISGGNSYPSATILAPGDEVKFEASTTDPSPLIIQAEMTQKSGWYMVFHMIITMLPGANQFGIQPSSVACITERLTDVSNIVSAVESLLNNNGAAAAESISKFMRDGDIVRRFLTAADDCHFGPAPTWSIKGFDMIGASVSTILSATDYIANYFAENNFAKVSFAWKSTNGLLGKWEGELSGGTDTGIQTLSQYELTISDQCGGQAEMCITDQAYSGVHFSYYLIQFYKKEGLDYYFGSNDSPDFIRITPQLDGTIKVFIMQFTSSEGYLNRKDTLQPANWWPESLVGTWLGTVMYSNYSNHAYEVFHGNSIFEMFVITDNCTEAELCMNWENGYWIYLAPGSNEFSLLPFLPIRDGPGAHADRFNSTLTSYFPELDFSLESPTCFTNQSENLICFSLINANTVKMVLNILPYQVMVGTLSRFESLDMTNAESIAGWINYGLMNGIAGVFNDILIEMPTEWGIWNDASPRPPCQELMGRWCTISKADFLNEINQRIYSKPQCTYSQFSDTYLSVEILNWYPLWNWPLGESPNVVFLFNRSQIGDNYKLINIYFDHQHPQSMIAPSCP